MTDNLLRSTGIAWGHVGRWFLRGRVFRIAIQVRMLTLASLGVLLTIFGWWLIAQPFLSDVSKPRADEAFDPKLAKQLAFQEFLKGYTSCPWTAQESSDGLPLGPLRDQLPFALGGPDTPPPAMGTAPNDAVVTPWQRLSTPVFQLFEVAQTLKGASFLALCIVWAAAVWGLFGGAITRSAVVQLTREDPPVLGAALGHALRRWLSYFGAPLLPLTAIGLGTLVLLLLGLVMRASILLAAIGWPLALLGGIVMALTVTGLVVGWPLMHATISAEGSDGFDALSRSYSYVYQRPLHYLLYGLFACALGLLGLKVVDFFATAVWQLTTWSVSWGSGNDLMDKVMTPSGEFETYWGVKLIHFWHGCMNLVVIGFAFSFFWTAVSAIYLLLRYDADGAELTEVFHEDSPQAYALPPLAKDAAGVPVVPPSEGEPPSA